MGECHVTVRQEARARGSRDLQGVVGRADAQAPSQRSEGVEERVEVFRADDHGRTEEELEHPLVQRLDQVGQQDVLVLDQHEAGGGTPDRRDLVPAPASTVRLGDDLEHGLTRAVGGVTAGGEVGDHACRTRAQREGRDAVREAR